MSLEILLSIVIFLILISIGICVLLWRKGAKALKEEKEELLKKQTEEFSETMTEINKCFEKLSVISTQATTAFEELFKNINKYTEEVEDYKENKEDELAQFIFEPYYIYTIEEIEADTGEKLKENIKSLLAIYLASGIDPNKNTTTGIDVNDITNTNGFNIQPVAADLVPAQYKNSDNILAVINGNYAIASNISISTALAIENANGDAASTYANILAVKSGNENNEKVLALIEVLSSQTVKDYITSTYNGAVLPM